MSFSKPVGAVFLLLSVIVHAAPGAERREDDVLVQASGFTITRRLLDEEEWCHFRDVGRMKATLPAATVDRRVLNTLINRHVVLAQASAADRAAGAERFRANLRDYKSRQQQTDEAFERELARRLAVWRLNRRRWEERNIEQCVMQVVLERDVDAQVTSEDVRRYYDENPTRFDQPAMAHVRRLLVTAIDARSGLRRSEAEFAPQRQELERCAEAVRRGGDFEALARALSEAHPESVTFSDATLVRGQVPPEIGSVVFGLAQGAASGVIASDSGFELLQLRAMTPPRRLTVAEAEPQIRATLRLGHVADYLDRIKREARVTIVDRELSTASVRLAREEPAAAVLPTADEITGAPAQTVLLPSSSP